MATKAKRKRYKAEHYFAKVAALRDAKAPARQITKLSDSWIKRGGSTVTGFFKAERAGVVVTKGAHHVCS